MSAETFRTVVDGLTTAKDKKGNSLDIVSIMVSEEDREYLHYFRNRESVDIRSIAKPIVCMALGAAIENGLHFDGTRIGLETLVWPLLTKYAKVHDPANLLKWQQIRLLDLLRITLGHDKGLMFSADVKEHDANDLVNYIVNYPITREVGKDFVYSNAGTFLISSMITEYLGRDLDQFVDELIFAPMGISDYTWKKYGKYTAGCTGLKMHNEDLHKVGRLLLNNGVYGDRQVVPKAWIEQMRLPQVPAPTHRYIADRAFPKWTYGLNLWICEDGNYYCDGTDGQYLIIIPKTRVVITTTAFQPDTEPISNCLGTWKNSDRG